MRRKDKEQKRGDALRFRFLKEKYIAEMKSRLRSFCVIDYFGLRHRHYDHWDTFVAVLVRTTAGENVTWLGSDSNLSFFDCVLLEWCCSTGEMRNHEALAAHTDANKSHSVESMQAFGRVEPRNAHLSKTSQVERFRDAYLCALWQMVAMRMRCGRDIWHLSLSNTYHVPDRSRDRYNVTWVHGP